MEGVGRDFGVIAGREVAGRGMVGRELIARRRQTCMGNAESQEVLNTDVCMGRVNNAAPSLRRIYTPESLASHAASSTLGSVYSEWYRTRQAPVLRYDSLADSWLLRFDGTSVWQMMISAV